MLEFLRQQLAELLTKRATLKSEMDGILVAPTTEKRDLNTDEAKVFAEKRDAIKAFDTRKGELEERIAELADLEERSGRADKLAAELGQAGEQRNPASGGARVTSEPLTYHRHAGQSYFLDLAQAQLLNNGEARGRLQRHAKEMDVEMPAREQRREQRAREDMTGIGVDPERKLGRRGSQVSVFEKRVNPNRVDGQGGYFVPPMWLIDEYIDLPRFGRTYANSVRGLTLPPGTDSINVPKISTGAKADVQTADAAAVTSQDMTDTFVTAPVRTIAGQQDVAMQLLDQSPASFDEITFADLMADWNLRLDTQCLTGTGSNGQVLGALNVSGINAITFTNGSPTLPLLYPPLMQSLSAVAKNRKMMPNAVFLTPSRWFWAAAQLDTQNRPLILPETSNPFNPMALQTGGDVEGPVGRVLNFPILADGNIPNNLGGGTNEERIVTCRTSDQYLWEGGLRTRVLQEVLSGTLQVRFQLYGYVAFMPHRRPESISVISGTGVIAPAGY